MMSEKVKVMLRDGSMVPLSNWQERYGLTLNSNQIGKYFSVSESRFQRDIVDYGELVVNEFLIRVLDGYRQAIGHPVIINSFNRNEVKQAQLRKGGFRAALHSPHVVKLAADVDTPGYLDLAQKHGYNAVLRTAELEKQLVKEAAQINYESAITMKQVANALNIKVRIGHKQYLKVGQTFIHVDVCPEYYAPGKPFHHIDHPLAWEEQITW